jgi:peroxiredoxin
VKGRGWFVAGFAAGVLLIAAASWIGVRDYRAARRTDAVTADATCPANAPKADLNFTLPDLDGTPVKLSDYSGKVLLLDFWATWCVPCQVEIPGFIDLHEKYKARGAAVVGLVMLDDFKNARPFAQAHGMTYPILNAVDREDIEKAFGPLAGLPTSFVISRDGRICAAHAGVPGLDTPGPSIEKSVEGVFESEIRALL